MYYYYFSSFKLLAGDAVFFTDALSDFLSLLLFYSWVINNNKKKNASVFIISGMINVLLLLYTSTLHSQVYHWEEVEKGLMTQSLWGIWPQVHMLTETNQLVFRFTFGFPSFFFPLISLAPHSRAVHFNETQSKMKETNQNMLRLVQTWGKEIRSMNLNVVEQL